VRTTADTDFHLIDMAAMQAEIVPGFRTNMWAYNGSVPGPTIRATRGRKVVARFVNRLPSMHPVLGYEAFTSIHLHGGASKPQYDGYASDIIHPGHFKDYRWDNNECARSLWFHDHAVHHTWTNVAMGLAAQYFIEDPDDAKFGLPSGEFDVPLHLSDAMFNADGQIALDLESLKGFWGDVILVNGRPWPVMQVQRRKYRFRVVNGCVARTFFYRLSTNDPFQVISTDAGLVPAPVTVNLADAQGAFHVDQAWVTATGFTF
jgi:FtsP/CotA-like multicopper oxidase with cupredoxin domain